MLFRRVLRRCSCVWACRSSTSCGSLHPAVTSVRSFMFACVKHVSGHNCASQRKKKCAILFTCIHIPVLENALPTLVAISSADLEESMFNVGFCVQHHTFSATLDMIDCVTAELFWRKVHLGAALKCATVLKCSGFAKHFCV